MQQEIVITDLTRMAGDRVCIAGINHQGATIRLEKERSGIPEYFLYQDGKPIIRPRAVVRVNVEEKRNCKPPHLEDRIWLEPETTQFLRCTDDRKWKDILSHMCYPSVEAIFETPLHRNRNVEPGTGIRSLGTIKPRFIHQFIYKTVVYDGREQRDYRLFFRDESEQYYASVKVNDLAVQYYANHLCSQPGLSQEDVGEKLTATFKRGQVWLRLGLTRPYEGWCWLQVTGIYTFPDYLVGKCFDDFK